MKIRCGGLLFTSDFDSGNLNKVEQVPASNFEMEVSSNSTDNLYNYPRRQFKSSFESPRNSPHLKRRSLKKSSLSSSTKTLSTESFLLHKQSYQILEFNVWTKPDCYGTVYETTCRTWFHFGVQDGPPGAILKINVMNLNRQGKLYFHGMKPVYKIIPSKEDWKRIPGKVDFRCDIDGNFIISFCHPLPLETGAITYFAFTYPFSYSECQKMLDEIDIKMGSSLFISKANKPSENVIYYCRELLCYTSEGNKVDLLTITSCKGLTMEREKSLPHLFPDHSKPRCHIFQNKKIVFISSRVHPGETPSSFVFNGLLHYLCSSKDCIASRLRNLYVFKLIPMLNPDGVLRGHYRTDLQGLNLNRIYMIANFEQHPSIYAARTLLLHYHTIYSSSLESKHEVKPNLKMPKIMCEKSNLRRIQCDSVASTSKNLPRELPKQVLKKHVAKKHFLHMSDTFPKNHNFLPSTSTLFPIKKNKTLFWNSISHLEKSNYPKKSKKLPDISNIEELKSHSTLNLSTDFKDEMNSRDINCEECDLSQFSSKKVPLESGFLCNCIEASDAEDSTSFDCKMKLGEGDASKLLKDIPCLKPEESGIAYFFDLHGHASKRGCFIYGNYFPDVDKMVECMFLPKLMSINCPYFDFSACNFSAENMYSGTHSNVQSKEGSGRVSLYFLTGIVHSYTLECNYNTCRFTTNQKRPNDAKNNLSQLFFTPEIYQQIGESLLFSLLDATGHNPKSTLSHSTFLSAQGVKEWLRQHALSVKGRVLKKDAPLSRARCKEKALALSMVLQHSSVLQPSSQKGVHRELSSSAANLDSDGKAGSARVVGRARPRGKSISLLSSPVSRRRPSLLQRRHTFAQDSLRASFRTPKASGHALSPS